MSWGLASMVLLVVALALQIAAFERGKLSARSLGLVAAMAALAVAGRLAFAPLPNVKPTTDIVLIAGFALGASPGFAVGAITALVSNMVFGQGPWTPWQMLLWGLAGASGGWLAPLLRRSRIALMAFGGAWGRVFGAGMDVWQLAAFGPALTLPAFIAVHARAVPFDLVHALTNVILLGVAGMPLIALLDRSARRMRGRWLPVEEGE